MGTITVDADVTINHVEADHLGHTMMLHVTVAAGVTITHVQADHLGHTKMLHHPKNNSNPAVFIGIFSFREHRSARMLSLRWNKSWKVLTAAVGGTMNLLILHLSNIAVVAL